MIYAIQNLPDAFLAKNVEKEGKWGKSCAWFMAETGSKRSKDA